MSATQTNPPRQRLSRAARQTQLMSTSWQMIRDEGTGALTLGRLAEAAGVSKPVVYDHFPTREALLSALYRDFDLRHAAELDRALERSPPNLKSRVEAFVANYLGCALQEGRELPDLIAALHASPDLAAIRSSCVRNYISKCRASLAPFTRNHSLSDAALWAMLGAADGLGGAVLAGNISENDAHRELEDLIMGLVARA